MSAELRPVHGVLLIFAEYQVSTLFRRPNRTENALAPLAVLRVATRTPPALQANCANTSYSIRIFISSFRSGAYQRYADHVPIPYGFRAKRFRCVALSRGGLKERVVTARSQSGCEHFATVAVCSHNPLYLHTSLAVQCVA